MFSLRVFPLSFLIAHRAGWEEDGAQGFHRGVLRSRSNLRRRAPRQLGAGWQRNGEGRGDDTPRCAGGERECLGVWRGCVVGDCACGCETEQKKKRTEQNGKRNQQLLLCFSGAGSFAVCLSQACLCIPHLTPLCLNTKRAGFVCCNTHKPLSGEEGRVDITKASLVSMAELTAQQGIEQEMAVRRTHISLFVCFDRGLFSLACVCLLCRTEPVYGHEPSLSNLKQ